MATTIGLGKNIRAARLGQALSLTDVEAQIGVRTKYLRALEWERFDLLPGERRAREAMRAYADCLGLDSAQYLAEYDARGAAPGRPQSERTQERRRILGAETLPVLIILVPALAAIAGVFTFEQVFRSTRDAAKPVAALSPRAARAPGPLPATRETPAAGRSRSSPPPVIRLARLEVSASRGDSWVVVRSGSSRGPILFAGTLARGKMLSLERRRLWLRLGAASNVDVSVNGLQPPVALYGTLDAIVSRAGFRKVPLAP